MTAGETEARIRQLKAERARLPWWSVARWKKGRELRQVILGSAKDGGRR